jgi:hypothetical protein
MTIVNVMPTTRYIIAFAHKLVAKIHENYQSFRKNLGGHFRKN